MERIILFSFLFFVTISNAFAFDYFNQSIDYWNKAQKKDSPPILKKEPVTKKESENKFNWNRYLNPKSKDDLKEVFREGNYTPPAPLLEVAQNPTDENIKRWFAVVKRKNELLSRVNSRMAEYLNKKKKLKPEEKKLIESKRIRNQVGKVDHKRFRFRMYFESSCPHCKRMMPELVKLQDIGFFIELRQIDNNKRYAKGLPFVVRQASQAELKEKKVNAWPVLFIGDTQKKLIYRINGYQNAESILLTLQSK